jgi:hypothetical protein
MKKYYQGFSKSILVGLFDGLNSIGFFAAPNSNSIMKRDVSVEAAWLNVGAHLKKAMEIEGARFVEKNRKKYEKASDKKSTSLAA